MVQNFTFKSLVWKITHFRTHFFCVSPQKTTAFFKHVWPQNRSQAWLVKQRRSMESDNCLLQVSCFESDNISKRRFPQEFVWACQNWKNVLDEWAIDHTVVKSIQAKVETPHEENRPTRSRSSTNICNFFPALVLLPLDLNVKKNTHLPWRYWQKLRITAECAVGDICIIHPKCIKKIYKEMQQIEKPSTYRQLCHFSVKNQLTLLYIHNIQK